MSGAALVRLSGALAEARPMSEVALYELVQVGHGHLMGEVIRVRGDTATLQVYEETTGLELGEPVEPSGSGLAVRRSSRGGGAAPAARSADWRSRRATSSSQARPPKPSIRPYGGGSRRRCGSVTRWRTAT